ncbi:MAG: hypothetical protein WAL91_12055 [Propionicimonas sp.]
MLATVVAGTLIAGCAPASPSTPAPAPSFRCTPEAGGAEFDCTGLQHDEMVAKDELYTEAEAVYRKYLAEDTRIMKAGGITEPSAVLLETTSGEFLDDVMENYRRLAENKVRARGEGPTLVSFTRAPGRLKTGSIVSVTTCVDAGRLEFIQGGKSLGHGLVALDENYFGRIGDVLKLVGADGKQVEKC